MKIVVDVPLLPEHAALGVIDVKPNMNFSEEQRRRHTIGCLKSIALAMEKYLKAHGQYPNRSIDKEDFGELLSWRVALLPYLGYEELHSRFDLGQGWDKPQNQQLLAQIPPVYRSPERGDASTNFLLFTGQGTPYPTIAGSPANIFFDGLDVTLLVAEFDDLAAVPWTKPVDHVFNKNAPRTNLFRLRGDGFFGIFGGGATMHVRGSTTDAQLRAMLTMQGDEPGYIAEFVGEPSVQRLVAADAARTASPKADPVVHSDPAATETGIDTPALSQSTFASSTKPVPPSSTELATAESLVKKIYRPLYEKAKTNSDRLSLAKRIFTEADAVRTDTANYFVMLRTARDIATVEGEIGVAIEAQTKIEDEFSINSSEITLPWAESAVKRAKVRDVHWQPLFDLTFREAKESLADDDFTTSQKFQELAEFVARKAKLYSEIVQVSDLGGKIGRTRRAYHQVAPSLHAILRSPTDPGANSAVGRYLCLSKEDWVRGLPYLVKGSDTPLKTPALMELENPATAEQMATIGDSYWSLSESWTNDEESKALKERGAYWYRKAVDHLPEGLRRILVQERLNEAEKPFQNT